jgi:hypothetical protein
LAPRRLLADAPNILIVFIDDAGRPSGDVRQRSANPDESTALSTAARRVRRHNLRGRLGVRGRANKPSANLLEPLSLGREVVESVARDHQGRATLNSTYLQDLEEKPRAVI